MGDEGAGSTAAEGTGGRDADLRAQLAEVVAREEIRDVVQAVARGTDRLDRELIASGYWPDAVDDHNVFAGGPEEFADWVLQSLGGFAATHHFLGQCHIRLDGDAAFAETYCDAHHVSAPDAAGVVTDMVLGLRYLDRFERRGGRWRIARRVCAFDWTYRVTSSDVWAFGEGFTVGRRDRTDPSYEGLPA